MGIIDRLTGDFSSLPPFAEAVSEGVKEEISIVVKPLQEELAAIKTQLAQLGIAVESAQSSADSAAQAAATAQSSADSAAATAATAQQTANQAANPTPTPSATPVATPPASGVPPITPQPTPTPSASPRQTVFVLTLPDPIFLGNILAGETFRPPATITSTPLEGAFYAGSDLRLEASNIDASLSFAGWYNTDTNELLGSSNPLTIRLPFADTLTITAKFSPR